MRYRAAALVLCFLAPPVLAQSISMLPLSPGQRVWIRPSPAPGVLGAGVKGTVEGMTGDSLRVRPAGGAPTVSVGFGPETQVFVLTGRRSLARRGATIGGLVGALAGAILGTVSGEECSQQGCMGFDPAMFTFLGAAVGLGIGGTGGAIIGSMSHRETWTRIGWTGVVHPVVLPRPRGVGLGLLLAF